MRGGEEEMVKKVKEILTLMERVRALAYCSESELLHNSEKDVSLEQIEFDDGSKTHIIANWFSPQYITTELYKYLSHKEAQALVRKISTRHYPGLTISYANKTFKINPSQFLPKESEAIPFIEWLNK